MSETPDTVPGPVPEAEPVGEAPSLVAAVTDATFAAEVLESEIPVLVDFWAEWCIPCRAVHPVLEQLAAEHGDKLKFVKLDIDKNFDTAAEYQIIGIPAFKVFKGGEVVLSSLGAKPKPALEAELAEFLA